MNNARWMRQIMRFGRQAPQLINRFQRRRNNRRGWTLISLLGLGTALGVVASRNRNVREPIQNLMQRTRNYAGNRGNNAAIAEMAKEFMPEVLGNQNPNKSLNQNLTQNQNQNENRNQF
ncbi:hypothetical protein [Bacillus litorisediminis]|uniref:hypothetical protein n=1 Tax=Bacillus litorisediminis TaxID=2922713 RepID=UPI001FAE01FB|nr:hypothetical protein [Bacillus litorisediminis]